MSTTEDDFQRAIDAHPDDWHTRLVFADWLDERGDRRAAGYRAIAVQRRRPIQGHNKEQEAWWWYCPPSETSNDDFHNIIPPDWFALLPRGEGSQLFWPVFTETGGVMTRRECEDALAVAFSQLATERQAALLNPTRTRSPSG